MSTPYQYHPAHSFTEKDLIDFRDDQQARGKARREHLAAIEKLPPAPKPVRKCNLCGLPLNALANCSKHAVEMRNYKTEFDLGCNWAAKLSEITAEELRLEEREEELLSAAEQLKGKRDEESQGKLTKILGYNFPTNATKHLDRPTPEHKDGLLDVVRNRLTVIREAIPKLVRAAQAYLQEQSQVPTEGQIFQQRKRQEASERILQ
jgi:hypothetical protein